MQVINNIKTKYPNIYEFVLFNVMSNVATISNFIVLWISNSYLFSFLSNQSFNWFIFKYPVSVGGLGGFISFMLAYIVAQIVNFFVQRKVVFNASVDIKKVLPWYIATVTVAGLISIWLPPYIIDIATPVFGNKAMLIANIVNIIIQVAINYPMMKFKIMKKK